MSISTTSRRIRHAVASFLLGCSVVIAPSFASAQSLIESPEVELQLQELMQIIKSRSGTALEDSLRGPETPTQNDLYLEAIDKLLTTSYSQDPLEILEVVTDFERIYADDSSLILAQIKPLFADYAHGLERELSSNDLQIAVNKYVDTGNWFEKFIALEVSSYLHSNNLERQAALQKSQLALGLIPENTRDDVYAKYAKIKITSTIAQLHNLQGNSALALEASLDYLKLTEDNPNVESEIDLINNLIFSYRVSRNHAAQLFLSQHLLELEKTHSSSLAGLSEMRIASVMNADSRFDEGLDYAVKALKKAEHPIILRNSKIYKAVALAGLGRTAEARDTGNSADVNFTKEHMLQSEDNMATLYLAFLLAQKEDPDYALRLVNRQLDVTAQGFLENNSRDTTAMLAELENSRGRQEEREAAAQRETALQAMTIDRQKKLNQTLMFLLFLLGGAALASILFARYRSRMVDELEIKTREAASAEKLKTEFLGMISHELRTPLNGIIGISDYLANYHEDEDIRHKTGIVLNSGNELLKVVESLTDMARIDAGQLELAPHDTDLGAALSAVPENWTEEAAAKGLKFTHYIDPKITRHHVDEERIVQCVNILLANAVCFTEAGRVHLHVTASKTETSDLTIVVADTGQGMSELVQSRLFTPFMQADTSRKRSHMGTGLSLAIAYALAEMMGGKLSCVSRDTRGSEFTLNIPLRDAVSQVQTDKLVDMDRAERLPAPSQPEPTAPPMPAPQAIAPKAITKPIAPVLEEPDLETVDLEELLLGSPDEDAAPAPRQDFVDLMSPSATGAALHQPPTAKPAPSRLQSDVRPQRVLIVDDMASNRDVLRLMLESQAHICSEAADGYAALAALERKSFDLILLDIHMSPLDGVETLKRLRASGKPYANIPVIALTADNAPSTNAETMDAGADLFLTKPVLRDELLWSMNYLIKAETTRILSQRA